MVAGRKDAETVLDIVVKRKAEKKSGFEVELRDDGFYYITKIPPKCKSIGVGDRVLAINGTKYIDFESKEQYVEPVVVDLDLDICRLGVMMSRPLNSEQSHTTMNYHSHYFVSLVLLRKVLTIFSTLFG